MSLPSTTKQFVVCTGGEPLLLDVIAAETFLIAPHPEVLTYMRNKTADYGRWIGGKAGRRGMGSG